MGRAVFIIFFLAAFAAPAYARADTLDQIRPQITAANNRYAPAVFHHDAAAIASDYLPDGVLIPRTGTPVRGRSAIAQYYAKRMSSLSRFAAINCATQRIAFDGTAVLEEGSCTFTPRASLKKPPVTGQFLTIWKKDSGGRWRIAVNE